MKECFIIVVVNELRIANSCNRKLANHKRTSSMKTKTFACSKTPDKTTLDRVYQLTYRVSRKLGRDETSSQERAEQAVKTVRNTWSAWASDDEPVELK